MSLRPLVVPGDPKAGYLAHKRELDEAIRRVAESGQYILGPEVQAFEQEFASYLGARHAIGVGSGTEALELALRARGIAPGDIVITVSHTAVATVAAIELAGAVPYFVDVDPTTFTMDPSRLEEAIGSLHAREESSVSSRLKAVLPVHLYGHPADMGSLTDIAERNNLLIIEDCAQAHGAAIQGQRAGTLGSIAAFSFYPTKNLGAMGDGGAVVTDDPRLAESVRSLREYGWRKRYISDNPGMNTRLDEVQAAILRVKLRYLDEENQRRREIARTYGDALSATSLTLPRTQPGVDHVYHQYVARTKRRDDLKSFLEKNSVVAPIHYPLPVHLQPAYKSRLAVDANTLPFSEQLYRDILSLPIHPYMSDGLVESVCELIVRWDQ